MSFARLVLSTSSVLDMPKFVNNVLPQRYEITPLINHYMENIHTLYPFLSEPKLFQSVDTVYQDNGRHALPIDRWTVRLVLATAIASLSRQRDDTGYQDAVRHAAAALEEIEAVVHPGSVVGIQAILQLVLYAMLDPGHFNSWYLIGLASRVMVDIGLHQDPPEELRLKQPELNMRLRVYDCVYALDRSVTLFPECHEIIPNLSDLTRRTRRDPFNLWHQCQPMYCNVLILLLSEFFSFLRLLPVLQFPNRSFSTYH